MKQRLNALLSSLARRIPLRLYPYLLRRPRVDFFYHAVADEPMPHVRWLYPVVPVEAFEAALRYLREHFTPVSYAALHAHYVEGAPLPPKAVHLSFDDGFRQNYEVVRPLLLAYEIPCTFFVVSEWVDNRAMFYRNKVSLCIERLCAEPQAVEALGDLLPGERTVEAAIAWLKALRLPDEPVIHQVCERLGVDWEAFLRAYRPYLTSEQIGEMRAEGFTIGAHSLTHRKLRGLPPEEIEREIAASCRAVGEISGQEIVPFSFPHSAFGLDRAHLAAVRARHPFIGLLFDTRGLRRDVDFLLNRVWAERPLTGEGGPHPLPEVLQQAYAEAWVEELLAFGRRIRRGQGIRSGGRAS